MMRKKTIIIAEAGVNHNGKLNNAIKLIDVAEKSGADYIKFQYTNPNIISINAKKANYQIKNTKIEES
jgi:N,N'-diacetyllegionaminate synthase